MLIEFFIGIGVVFGLLAGLIAFLITYDEWQKHLFVGWKLWREPLVRGLFAFVVFFVLSVVIGFLLTNFVIQR